jgi:ferrochelatase
VSEHIETLVELDIEYRHLADKLGANHYIRAPALGIDEGFIGTLADLVDQSLADPDKTVRSSCGGRICPANWGDCPNRRMAATKAA